MNLKAKMLTLAAAALLVSGSAPAIADEAGLESFTRMQKHIVEVSDQLKSSVVHIEVMSRRNSEHRKGLGSGLIISEDGRIVTNYHVIDRAQSITVILDDKTKHPAEIVRSDAQTDLAVIKIKADRKLSPAKLGDSGNVQVGEWVLAIGNPYGFDRTVSFGIVSGKGRFIPGINNTDVPIINDFIQTDALIDPGNSGGPLVNTYGEVVGIVSAKYSSYSSTTVEGIGFAIPINDVLAMIEDIMTNGYVTNKPFIGITPGTMTKQMAQQYRYDISEGVFVYSGEPGSAADKAGLKMGDVILKIDGKEIKDTAGLTAAKKSYSAGDTATFTIYRGGETMEIQLTFGVTPEDTTTKAPAQDSTQGGYYNGGGFYDPWSWFFGNFGF